MPQGSVSSVAYSVALSSDVLGAGHWSLGTGHWALGTGIEAPVDTLERRNW